MPRCTVLVHCARASAPGRRKFSRGADMMMTNRTNEIEERQRVEDLARALSQQSVHEWQRAIQGLVALPAAMVTGAAATTLYAVGFVARGFEVFLLTAAEQGRDARRIWQGGDAERLAGSERGQERLGSERRGNEQGPELPRA
jgi:hypothetical protein